MHELASNAVDHARSASRVTLSLDGRGLVIAVRDFCGVSHRALNLVGRLARRDRGVERLGDRGACRRKDDLGSADGTRPSGLIVTRSYCWYRCVKFARLTLATTKKPAELPAGVDAFNWPTARIMSGAVLNGGKVGMPVEPPAEGFSHSPWDCVCI